jgi:hypothetical protein
MSSRSRALMLVVACAGISWGATLGYVSRYPGHGESAAYIAIVSAILSILSFRSRRWATVGLLVFGVVVSLPAVAAPDLSGAARALVTLLCGTGLAAAWVVLRSQSGTAR